MENSNGLRRLGKSELMVSPLGLGCWQFSKQNSFAGKYWPDLDDDLIRNIVEKSIQGGINWFDTAELYGKGASEKALSRSLAGLGIRPGEVIIATKWWPMFRTASNIPKTIDERLSALSPFPIDLYMIHQPYGFSGEKEEMNAMAALVDTKKIRYVGVSNFSAAKMRNAWEALEKKGIPLVSNQVRYSLLDRSIESNGVLRTARELGISIIAYSPLAQGLVTGKFHDDPALLRTIGMRKYTSFFRKTYLEKSFLVVKLVKDLAVKYQATPSQIALNWLINHNRDIVFAIPGSTKVEQAVENAGALNFRLSEEDMNLLDRTSAVFK